MPAGRGFGKLWTAAAVSNVGDGVVIAAGPLLVASLTDNPALIGGAVFVQQLPWLLFSLLSGAWVDRLDKRLLITRVDVVRGLLLGVLAVSVATDTVGVWLIYAVFFLLGTAETLADTASVSLLPAIVPAEALPRANARLMGTQIVANQLVGPPFGAFLFVAAAAYPFGLRPGSSSRCCRRTWVAPRTRPSAVHCGRRSARACGGCCTTRCCACSRSRSA